MRILNLPSRIESRKKVISNFERQFDASTQEKSSTAHPIASGVKLIIVTKDFSGLGFAKLALDSKFDCLIAYKNEEVKKEDLKSYSVVGNGIIPKIPLDELMTQRKKYKSAKWIFDSNHHYKESELLSKEGFNVFGSSELMYKMEKDRKFGTDLVSKAGIKTPPTYEFNEIKKGIEFLDQNEDKAYVFKPDISDGAYTTYVPDATEDEKANRELYDYLISQQGQTGTYILQERIKGTEVNIEYFVYKGKPFLCHANLECKRRSNKDEGEMVGCSQDISWIVPINCKLAVNTIAKILKVLPGDYTGFVDCNVIVANRDFYFLEFCARFGYNAHPNLFINLALRPFAELMSDWMDGRINKFEENFKYGFGASIGLRIDHPKQGYPIYIPEDVPFYMFDQYKNKDKYNLAGYGNEVGVVLAHGMTIQTVAEECIKNLDRITYPNHDGRTDLDKKDYLSSPQLRKEALDAAGMFI